MTSDTLPEQTPEQTQRRHGLPVEVTGFVGRQRELTELSGLLSSARLVTVTGPGGVGKTRLALRVAAALAGSFADGVCLAELSSLRDPELLPHTVATALGLSEAGASSRLDAIADYLRDRSLLLILDTCEHLVDACAMFAEVLLRATTKVTVLATSRQPLDVPGEHTFAVGVLDCADAVELFAQRAATVIPGFAVTEASRPAVAALCQRLDGVPLALELATVRLRALSLEQLSERLEDRFRLLTGGRRAALPHHQTLRTATEWSYDLCTPAEQLLWARLSVFAGSFSIAAAEAVSGDEGLPAGDVLATLIGLVDKSVVLRVEHDGSTRYRLLDTIREFGAEKLAEAGPEAACGVRSRYLDHFTGMTQDFGDHFADDQLADYRALRSSHADLRAAVELALDTPGREADAARLVSALYGYWHIAGLPREGKYWVTKVLERFAAPSAERARLLIVRCYLVTGAEADGREGIALAEGLGEPWLAARGYLYLHLALAACGHLAEATVAGAEAEERLTALGDLAGLHILDAQVGQMHAVAGEPDEALARCARGLARDTAHTEVWETSYMHYTRGLALFQQGKYDESTAAVRTALTMKSELGDTMGIAHCLEVLAWVAVCQRRHERAAWLTGAAGALWQRTGRRVSGNPFLEEFHQQTVWAADDELGAERSGILRRRGAAAPLDHVVRLAIEGADDLTLPDTRPARQTELPGGLTVREHEIAMLVADGLSNREIAHRLVISKRTVDAHIEHIFGKLGVSSRVQLATWLRRSLDFRSSDTGEVEMASGLTRRTTPGLPAEVTGFVGRRQEQAKLATLLRSARLVTVTGPGGVGKTRLSLRVAAKVAGRFGDGVCLVELAGLRAPELLPHMLATSLGLPEQDTRPQLDAVLDYLRDREMLLILDTCEHLIDACSMLASTVVRSAAGVTVLATSRQTLDANGEHVLGVPPLPEPDAIELFAQRAATAVPGFAVSDANRGDVVKLCRWLDGIPLAIELATVRLRAVPLDQLAVRLADRFLLLTGERRDALPHHQTLRTAIGWSYDLCTPVQQLLWARLSVFAGSFRLTDAERVCAGDPLAETDVLRTLMELVDKSVVALTGDGRYRLLDTIREFGAERLAESGAEASVRARHVDRYVAMARYFHQHVIAEDQLDRYRELRAEHDNIRAALGYAFDAGDLDTEAAALATDLYAYWQISGLLGEGRYWMAKVLGRYTDPSPERAWALVMIGILAALQGEIADALAVLDEGIPMAERLGQDLTGARGYGHRTLAYGFGGRPAEAAAAAAVASARAAVIGDEAGLVALDVEMSLLHLHNGDPHKAIEQSARGLARFHPGSAERWMQGWLNFYTGLAQFLLGSLEESAATLRTALTMKHELGDSVGTAYCLEVLGWVASAWQRFDRTAWLLGAADTLWTRAGTRLSGDAQMEGIRQHAATAASDALGQARYAALYGRGARDRLDHTVAVATGDEDATEEETGSELTSRQRQIAALVADGLSNKEIAARLVISKRTVDAHIDHIFAKLGVSSRTQLAARLAAPP